MTPPVLAPNLGDVARQRSRTGGTDMAAHLAQTAAALTLYLVLQVAALYLVAQLWVL